MTVETSLTATGAPRLARRADVQGLRAIAVIMVVLFHAGIDVPGGYTGVDVFFVISGFVITSLIVREVTGTGHLSFRDFYSRRVRRILPASALYEDHSPRAACSRSSMRGNSIVVARNTGVLTAPMYLRGCRPTWSTCVALR